ncbi:hypothetical protein [Volucribacter amazonae]|uniref:SMI1/KNR4 family protein n=1 Tax=Volucribacter amazonae TaxID=256731 RepID=A0A9X4SM83_9PAST|nr:hypothetical protein [Volucribacter amazonae]MDG6895828.1 hypothetical protein [Volucribacter amazonae]
MKIRTFSEITSSKLNKESHLTEVIKFFAGKYFSSDFIFIPEIEMNDYNELLESHSLRLEFTIFATNICGDLWLVNKNNKIIYFYDHNSENVILENFINTEINIYDWITYADLSSQNEYAEENNLLSDEENAYFIREIPKILKVLLGLE